MRALKEGGVDQTEREVGECCKCLQALDMGGLVSMEHSPKHSYQKKQRKKEREEGGEFPRASLCTL